MTARAFKRRVFKHLADNTPCANCGEVGPGRNPCWVAPDPAPPIKWSRSWRWLLTETGRRYSVCRSCLPAFAALLHRLRMGCGCCCRPLQLDDWWAFAFVSPNHRGSIVICKECYKRYEKSGFVEPARAGRAGITSLRSGSDRAAATEGSCNG